MTRESSRPSNTALPAGLCPKFFIYFIPIRYRCFVSILLLFPQSCLNFCDPMDCSMPGFPVLHYFWEFDQIHVHWVGDAIKPSHPLLPPSPLALSLFQHQGLFQLFTSIGQSPGALASAPVLTRNIQGWLPLGLTGLISVLSKGLLQHHNSKASILWRSAFFKVQLSHSYMTTGKPTALTRQTFVIKVILYLGEY